jgi:hypothetical protein
LIKDYLNATERDEMIVLMKLTDKLDEVANNPIRKNFTKEEKTNFRKATTFAAKALKSIQERMNDSALLMLSSSYAKTRILTINEFGFKRMMKKREVDFEKGYEASKDYFDLVELTMDKNCKNCTECANNCLLYHHLENNYIADAGYNINNCKYAYPSK